MATSAPWRCFAAGTAGVARRPDLLATRAAARRPASARPAVPPPTPSTICSNRTPRSNCRRSTRSAQAIGDEPDRRARRRRARGPPDRVARPGARRADHRLRRSSARSSRSTASSSIAIVVIGCAGTGTGRPLRHRPRDRPQAAARDDVDRRRSTHRRRRGRRTTRQRRRVSSAVTGTTSSISTERIGFAIGDIVGRGHRRGGGDGPGAQRRPRPRQLLRQAARARRGPRPLRRRRPGCGEDSSMAYLTIDRHSGEVAYAVAGHPPPLVLLPDGERDVARRGEQLACSGAAGRVRAHRCSSTPGTTIVLYTDGLVERRGESLDAGLATARRRRSDAGRAGAPRPARQLVER